MSFLKTSLILAACAVLSQWAKSAQAQNSLSLDAALWKVGAAGNVSVGADGTSGTELEVDDDLGLDGSDNVVVGAIHMGFTHQLVLSYLDFELTGQGALQEDARFGNADFLAGQELNGSLELQALGAGYRYAGSGDAWSSGFSVELVWFEVEARASASRGEWEKGDLDLVLPAVGVFAEWKPAMFLALGGSLRGGAWDWQETSLNFMQAQADVRLLFHPFVLGVGYRRLALQGDDTSLPLELDLNFSGPLVFAGITF